MFLSKKKPLILCVWLRIELGQHKLVLIPLIPKRIDCLLEGIIVPDGTEMPKAQS